MEVGLEDGIQEGRSRTTTIALHTIPKRIALRKQWICISELLSSKSALSQNPQSETSHTESGSVSRYALATQETGFVYCNS